jgi:hypothetical protein
VRAHPPPRTGLAVVRRRHGGRLGRGLPIGCRRSLPERKVGVEEQRQHQRRRVGERFARASRERPLPGHTVEFGRERENPTRASGRQDRCPRLEVMRAPCCVSRQPENLGADRIAIGASRRRAPLQVYRGRKPRRGCRTQNILPRTVPPPAMLGLTRRFAASNAGLFTARPGLCRRVRGSLILRHGGRARHWRWNRVTERQKPRRQQDSQDHDAAAELCHSRPVSSFPCRVSLDPATHLTRRRSRFVFSLVFLRALSWHHA